MPPPHRRIVNNLMYTLYLSRLSSPLELFLLASICDMHYIHRCVKDIEWFIPSLYTCTYAERMFVSAIITYSKSYSTKKLNFLALFSRFICFYHSRDLFFVCSRCLDRRTYIFFYSFKLRQSLYSLSLDQICLNWFWVFNPPGEIFEKKNLSSRRE